MKDLIKKMVEEMVAQSIAEVMAEMMGTKPEVAKAETTDSIKNAYKPKTLSREDFLNSLTVEEKTTPKADYSTLDFDIVSSTMCKFNQYVPKAIWELNDMIIVTQWGGKCTKYRGEFVWRFEDKNKLALFLQSYKIRLEPTEEDTINLANFKKAKAQKRADYYNKKANQ